MVTKAYLFPKDYQTPKWKQIINLQVFPVIENIYINPQESSMITTYSLEGNLTFNLGIVKWILTGVYYFSDGTNKILNCNRWPKLKIFG